MKLAHALMGLIAGAAILAANSQAADAAAYPDDFEAQAATYVESRLEDARGARIQVVSEPYKVSAEIGDKEGIEGWGVDIKVRARLPDGQYGRYLPYTVLFMDGEAVALSEDVSDIVRL